MLYLRVFRSQIVSLVFYYCEFLCLINVFLGCIPTTTAELPSPWSLELSTATWEEINSFFGQAVADGVPKQDSLTTDSVRTKISRKNQDDDMVMSLDITPETKWLPTLFPNGSAHVSSIRTVLGPIISEAIDSSQLRKWEIENGFKDQTRCVLLTHSVKLRLAPRLDFANALYSHTVSA